MSCKLCGKSPSIDPINWCATNEAIQLDDTDTNGTNGNHNPRTCGCDGKVGDSGHASPEAATISVQDGVKSYGRHLVLNHINMTVGKGTIYALLGASGCGKTTLLSCIVGTKVLNSGQITFNGEGLEDIKISRGGLREKVGYMPQELALYKEFTIGEALLYFGRIFGMDPKFISQQTEFLIEFLQLPKKNTEIRQMSGGQQRRVSFAVALLHSPDLLILDEPTVGVDAVLRKSIWEHLRKLVMDGKTTVIITTHYIEEASGSNVIGMMRNGRILAEGAPDSLLSSHGCGTLEQLFLQLSLLDENEVGNGKKDENLGLTSPEIVVVTPGKSKNTLVRLRKISLLPYEGYFNRLSALILKNLISIWRQLIFVFVLLFLPAIEIFLCCWAVGNEPWGLTIGIVNHEVPLNQSLCSEMDLNKTCEDVLLSCDFIKNLENLRTFTLKHFPNEEQALDSVQSGTSWGYITIPEQFTKHTLEKAVSGLYAENYTVQNSALRIHLDMTNWYTASTIKTTLFETFQELMKNMIIECEPEYVAEIVDGHLWFEEPIYGNLKPTLAEYMGPGILLIVMYFAAISVTGMSYVLEKKQGMLERTIVAGVSPTEIITAQFLTQYVIIAIQTVLSLAVLFVIFKMEINDQLPAIVLLILMQGSLGMLAGFFLSSICDEESVVMQLSTALTIPCTILGGTIWPLSAMPTVLQYVAFIFIPQTFANESLRSMFLRGWGITHPNVWPGFAVTVAWLIVLWTVANIFARRSVSPKN